MRLAYTTSDSRGQVDRTLSELAETLMTTGVKLAGVVQTNSNNCDFGRCDMDVCVLPDGPAFRISQSLGRDARGCRLDPGALEQAVGVVAARLENGADLLVVNKFGKHEAEGRGFRPLIADALARDIPVLLGLSRLSRMAFDEFTGGAAEFVAPETDALLAWFRSAAAESEPAQA